MCVSVSGGGMAASVCLSLLTVPPDRRAGMVLEIRPDTGEIKDHRYASRVAEGCRTNTAAL